MQQEVSVWVEKIMIPTYGVGKPEKNPIFLEKRVYQGSRGVVYPHPVIEKILDEKKDQEYTAVFIENKYLRIMVLPQLGGRIQRAFDKIRNRDFIYYNQVIKPALVGLTGPWISGGIEFNWPQHHRPSTFDPVDFTIQEYPDGSKTIWVNEVELMTRTKGMAGFTLYPGKAYLEVKGRIFNRSVLPQSFLWWANPAVKVNDYYQSVFPPDVYAVFDHGKRDVSSFPIANGVYYKVDYSPGTDISRYKNIPAPTSYMAIQSKYDFIGSYEHDKQAGMLHVANHHISPGKKQWTWGNSDFGRAWDDNLTDEDGPYIELMCGVFTDNQPDFSWIQPNEGKTFEQYFMPYARIGLVKNATRHAAVNLELEAGKLAIKAYATATYPDAQIRLSANNKTIRRVSVDLSPELVYEEFLPLNKELENGDLLLEVFDKEGKLLAHYQQEKLENREIPPPAEAAKPPSAIESNELLFLNGLHLEQYRHATYSPVDYWIEALRRDAGDLRCNNAMGVWFLRRGKFVKAESYFRKAISRLLHRNPNPYDGEPFYHLGLCLKMQGRSDEAFDAFYKAVWNDAWQHNGFFQLASIAAGRQNFEEALYLINKSLGKNEDSPSARHYKAVFLRKLRRSEEAEEWIRRSLELDPFNYGCRFEFYLILKYRMENEKADRALNDLKLIIRNDFNNYTEYMFDYYQAGLYEEAIELMIQYEKESDPANISPLMYYYLGVLNLKADNLLEAKIYFRKAAAAKPDCCFPGKIEDVTVLQAAIEINPADAKAYYYLGNFWYANAQYADAISCWEKSIALDDGFATVHRNMSLACYNKLNNTPMATAALEKAFALDPTDARVLMELDQLYKRCNRSLEERLQLLEKHMDLVEQRDDLYLERITLYNQLRQNEKAIGLMEKWKFHPWEGGEGKTVAQYLICYISLAKKAIKEKKYSLALELLSAAETYPRYLGEGKLPGAQENDIHFLKGLAYEKAGLNKEAGEMFQRATQGISEPVQAIFYNDPQPDKIFYQGLAWIRLGEADRAKPIFNRLIEFGKQHLNDEVKLDYFAVSLPDLLVFDQDLNLKNNIHCYYLSGLGRLGLAEYEEARTCFDAVLNLDINHQGALTHLDMIDFLKTLAAQSFLE